MHLFYIRLPFLVNFSGCIYLGASALAIYRILIIPEISAFKIYYLRYVNGTFKHFLLFFHVIKFLSGLCYLIKIWILLILENMLLQLFTFGAAISWAITVGIYIGSFPSQVQWTAFDCSFWLITLILPIQQSAYFLLFCHFSSFLHFSMNFAYFWDTNFVTTLIVVQSCYDRGLFLEHCYVLQHCLSRM